MRLMTEFENRCVDGILSGHLKFELFELDGQHIFCDERGEYAIAYIDTWVAVDVTQYEENQSCH